MSFDVEAAKKAGYSEDEILQHLTQTRKFDIQGAINAGYSKQEIIKHLSSTPTLPEPKKTVGGFLGNVVSSSGNFIKSTYEAVRHPIKTAEAIGKIGAGLMEQVIPTAKPGENAPEYLKQISQDSQKNIATTQAVGQFFKDRYGSIDNIKNTIYNDPVGFAADLSVVLGGVEGLATKAGEVSKIGAISNTAKIAGKTAEIVNPATYVGKGISMLGKGTASTIKKIVSPFSKSYDADAADIASKVGIELPASSLTDSKVVPLIEATTAKGIFGSKMANKVEQAGQQINDLVDTTINKISTVTDPFEAGKMAINGVNRFKNVWQKTKDSLFKEAVIPKGTNKAPAIVVDPSESLQFINTILEKEEAAAEILGGTSSLKFFKNLQTKLSSGKINAFTFKTVIQELNKKAFSQGDPLVLTGNRAVLKSLLAKMNSDLDTAIATARPDLASAIEVANQHYASGLDQLNGAFGKVVQKFSDKPEKIAEMLFKQAVPSNISELKTLIGEPAFNAVKSSFIKKIFDESVSTTDGLILKSKLTSNLNKYDDVLRASLNSEQYTAIKNIEKLVDAYKKSQAITKGSQTAFLGKIATELGLIFVHPLTALKVFVGDLAFSKFIASDVGQKWLTSGFKPDVSKLENINLAPPQLEFQAGRINENTQ